MDEELPGLEPEAADEGHESPPVEQSSEAEAEAKPAKKRGSRRAASRPAGPPAAAVFSAAEVEASVTAEVALRPSTAMVAAVFQAPEVVPTPAAKQEAEADAQAEVGESDPAESDTGTESDDGAEAPEGGQARTGGARRRRRRGGRGRGRRAENSAGDEQGESDDESGQGGESSEGSEGPGEGSESDGSSATDDATESSADEDSSADTSSDDGGSGGSRRRRRRRRKGGGDNQPDSAGKDSGPDGKDEVTAVKGSTRLEAKKQRRREGRATRGMRAPILTEAEFLARRESVERAMVVRQRGGLTQIGVLEDKVLVEHYVASEATSSLIGNVYLGRVQNVLPSMEAAFVDIGRGRNAVLYAGEVNWDAAGLEGQPKRIELALKSGDTVLVQATKDPVGHKGARLTSQISLPGRFLVYVPEGGMTGISRKLPDRERARLKKILRAVVPEDAGVIVRTAAEGASEEHLRQDVERLAAEWERIKAKSETASAPSLLRSEPDLTLKVARDIFNEDFASMVVSGDRAFNAVHEYVSAVAPDLADRVTKWTEREDVFAAHRIDEQIAKALDRKVWLPSGGSLVIDRTEAMTVIDVNTGKFTGKGGNLEETVTRNNLEAADEIVRQLRLRDIGGIIVVDFIDMVLESNRELVLRRLVECLSRDRTKHQVAEVTSLGLVQMTRKRIGQGLLETFSTPCEQCHGRGVKVATEPVGHHGEGSSPRQRRSKITGPIPGAPTNTVHVEAEEAAEAAEVETAAEEAVAETAAAEAAEVETVEETVADLVEDAPTDRPTEDAVQ
ncbi:MAG: Rne/Rng family ribonuclease [Actinobacteria bacterium]|nr:Rne/Rng family ribonuclease [Actinomycetota bacterium]MCB9413248.1 Rne/Rng family ribonuclease [Actinomycetota bacterium]